MRTGCGSTAVRRVDGFSHEQVLACAARAHPPANGGHRHEHATDAAVVLRAAGVSRIDRQTGCRASAVPVWPAVLGVVVGEELASRARRRWCWRRASMRCERAHRRRGDGRDGLRVIAVAHRTLPSGAGAARARAMPTRSPTCAGGLGSAGSARAVGHPARGAPPRSWRRCSSRTSASG